MKHLFSLVLVLLFSSAGYAEPVLSKAILAMPTLLLLDNGTGSGFIGYDDNYIYLVTAKHVLFWKDKNNKDVLNTTTLSAVSRATDDDQIELKINIEIEKLYKAGLVKCSKDHDVAVVRIGVFKDNGTNFIDGGLSSEWKQHQPLLVNLKAGFRTLNQVAISNNIYIFGYPTSIGIENIQIDPLVPLLRKGIVAGKNYKTKKIIIDGPSYQGNSGGPVMMVDEDPGTIKYLLIGIVVEFVPYVETWMNDRYPGISNTSIHNTGYSVVEPMDYIIDTVAMFNEATKK